MDRTDDRFLQIPGNDDQDGLQRSQSLKSMPWHAEHLNAQTADLRGSYNVDPDRLSVISERSSVASDAGVDPEKADLSGRQESRNPVLPETSLKFATLTSIQDYIDQKIENGQDSPLIHAIDLLFDGPDLNDVVRVQHRLSGVGDSGRTISSLSGKTGDDATRDILNKKLNDIKETLKRSNEQAVKDDVAAIFAKHIRPLHDRRSATLPRTTDDLDGPVPSTVFKPPSAYQSQSKVNDLSREEAIQQFDRKRSELDKLRALEKHVRDALKGGCRSDIYENLGWEFNPGGIGSALKYTGDFPSDRQFLEHLDRFHGNENRDHRTDFEQAVSRAWEKIENAVASVKGDEQAKREINRFLPPERQWIDSPSNAPADSDHRPSPAEEPPLPPPSAPPSQVPQEGESPFRSPTVASRVRSTMEWLRKCRIPHRTPAGGPSNRIPKGKPPAISLVSGDPSSRNAGSKPAAHSPVFKNNEEYSWNIVIPPGSSPRGNLRNAPEKTAPNPVVDGKNARKLTVRHR